MATTHAAHKDLTFGVIADAWALETAGNGWKREQILRRMVRAMWMGEFEESGKSLLSLMTPDGAGMITRRGLLRVLELKGILPRLPERQSSGDDGGEERLAQLALLSPAQFGPLVCAAYLEALIIARDSFGAWCDRQGMARPSFWFSPPGQREEPGEGASDGL